MPRPLYPFLVALFLFIGWKYYHNSKRLELCQKLGLDLLNGVQKNAKPPEAVQVRHEPAQFCVGEMAEKCVRPLIEFKQRYRTAGKYKLLGCAIEKNFSTMLTAILCYLHNEKRFTEKGREIVTEMFHKRFCGPINEFETLSKVEDKFSLKTKNDWKQWRLLAVVRHPFDRLVSGFTDKCLREQTWKKYPDRCNQCKRNLTCFMERQYSRMLKKAAGEKIRANFDDDHFYPQSWRCEFHSHLHDYRILQFDSDHPTSFIDRLLKEISIQNVSEKAVQYLRSSLSSGRTSHSTVDSPERSDVTLQLRTNRYLMDLLIKMYYYDFVLFGFPLPTPPMLETPMKSGLL